MTSGRFAGVPMPALQVATFKEWVKYPGQMTRGVSAGNSPL